MQHGERERELMIEVAHFRREVEMAMQALATALRERDAEKAARVRAVEGEKAWCAAAQTRERDRAAANARANHAETNLVAVREMLATHVEEKLAAQEALAAARRECELLRGRFEKIAEFHEEQLRLLDSEPAKEWAGSDKTGYYAAWKTAHTVAAYEAREALGAPAAAAGEEKT